MEKIPGKGATTGHIAKRYLICGIRDQLTTFPKLSVKRAQKSIKIVVPT